ncbi:putative tRNA pseudouridine38/39 synthase [Giardia muris]|uniref:tRNA pseudouridine synthase n=1 Tax=Giardia muris TaxID=5742 RepID=A0A4Z1T2G2_GIAMU|nr:putative tRNA pseudouridine38/39 synthase [Giardia muris]|eukprot:TNJ26601.1 putative tRNA pseudouridine38/39 synthase [Giardia muris]
MTHVLLLVAYTGRETAGNAYQGPTVATVERYLYEALERLGLLPSETTPNETLERTGRTDAGVGARAMLYLARLRRWPGLSEDSAGEVNVEIEPTMSHLVTHPDTPWGCTPESVAVLSASSCPVFTLNRFLPSCLRVLGASPVGGAPTGFSPRHDCVARHYRYVLGLHCDASAVARAKDVAHRFLGSHDWTNFCRLEQDQQGVSRIRQIYTATVTIDDAQRCVFEVVGSAFLYHQIRYMASALLHVMEGHVDPDLIAERLNPGIDAELDTSNFKLVPAYLLTYCHGYYRQKLPLVISLAAERELGLHFLRYPEFGLNGRVQTTPDLAIPSRRRQALKQ